jgi:uncharacterized protein (TIGR03663 family)
MNRWGALALLLAFAGALALRCPKLDERPLHNDEAINAIKFAALWEKGEYSYDPHEFHGPSLYYSALPFAWLSPARNPGELKEATLRLVPLAFGAGLLLLLLLLRDGLGGRATAWAAIFTAVSPAMVYYSRYFIHEMALVFFTLLSLAAGWRYWQTRQTVWAALTGAGLGLMSATKETFVLSVGALGLSVLATAWWNQWRLQRSSVVAEKQTERGDSVFSLRPLIAACKWKHLALAGLMAAVFWLVLFTSFFSHGRGLADPFLTYLPWLQRAGGDSPHIHPWHFYFERLLWFQRPKGAVWSEGLIMALALVGLAAAFCSNRALIGHPTLARVLAFYTLSLTGIYSVISYKTPWCLLNFWLGMILLAGVGSAALLQLCGRKLGRALLTLALIAGTGHLAWQAWRAGVTYASSPKNPYVYAHTSPDMRRLVERVEGIARVSPQGQGTVVKVFSPDSYLPLPWYLRHFTHAGWWEKLPDDPYAPIIIASTKLSAALDEKSNKAYLMTGLYELRPGVFLELYVEMELWKKFLATLPRETE